MAEEFDIFNIGVGDLDTGETKTGGSDLYAPKPEQGSDGTYSSLIRFLPNINNPRKPYLRKYVYWLEDSDGKGFYVDSPSTIGEKCPVQDMFFKLRNSESAVDKKMSDNLKRKEVYYALIQIVKDPQNPSLEGQTRIFKFGWKIKQKIDDELNPKFDDPVQVFDPFEGKNFELNIIKKGGYPNYDGCKFQSKTTPMLIDGNEVSDDSASKKAIIEYLKAAPELSKWDYSPWTEDDRTRVMNVLAQYSSPGSSIATVTRSRAQDKPAAITTESEDSAVKTSKKPAMAEASTSSSSDENLDDFLDGLDL